MSRTGNKGDFTNKTSSNEEAPWEEQDQENQQSICDAPDCVQLMPERWTQSSYLQRYILFLIWTSQKYHSPIFCRL